MANLLDLPIEELQHRRSACGDECVAAFGGHVEFGRAVAFGRQVANQTGVSIHDPLVVRGRAGVDETANPAQNTGVSQRPGCLGNWRSVRDIDRFVDQQANDPCVACRTRPHDLSHFRRVVGNQFQREVRQQPAVNKDVAGQRFTELTAPASLPMNFLPDERNAHRHAHRVGNRNVRSGPMIEHPHFLSSRI